MLSAPNTRHGQRGVDGIEQSFDSEQEFESELVIEHMFKGGVQGPHPFAI